MKAELHPVTGKNRYCGPTAIATICGISTDDASKAIRSISGKRAVCGVPTTLLLTTLRQLGCQADLHQVEAPTTARAWALANKALYKDRHVILVYAKHFGTLLGNQFLCSLTEKKAVPIKEMSKGRGRVVSYIVVHQLPDSVPTIPDLHSKIQLRPPEPVNRVVGYGLGTIDADDGWPPARKSIALTEDEYYELERAMQWPEDLPAYDLAAQARRQAAGTGSVRF